VRRRRRRSRARANVSITSIENTSSSKRYPNTERIEEETDENIITGKKRKKLKVDTIRKGTKVFDAIDPSMNTGTPSQGIPKIK